MKKIAEKCAVLALLGAALFGAYAQQDAEPKKQKKVARVKVVETVEDAGAFQAKNIDIKVGSVRYLMKGHVGSYQLYAVPESGLQTPLFASYDEFTSSFYDLKIGKRIYRLTDNVGTIIGVRADVRGGQIVYVVPNKARVFVKFEKMDEVEGVESEIIKVTANVFNKGKRTETFALKSVMDTVLGEKHGLHFSSAAEPKINTERQFRRTDEMKWLTSSDGKTSLQFLLDGADVSEIEVLSISNKDFLKLPNWVPSIVGERTFDSVLSYNNSALCINWPEVTLAPGTGQSFVYYMAVSTDGAPADGEKYIAWHEEKFGNEAGERGYSVKEFEDLYNKALELYQNGDYQAAYDVIMGLWAVPEHRNDRLAQLKAMIEAELNRLTEADYDAPAELPPSAYEDQEAEEEATEPDSGKKTRDSNEDIKFDVNSITAEQLNPAYVQGLIDRINALENSDGTIDRGEILRLNAELDAILEKLRQ